VLKGTVIPALALALASSAAGAQQGYPARTDCDTIVRELQMRPPSFGDPSRANYDWGNYVGFCEHPPWNTIIGADDVQVVAKVLHPGLYK
jgi:hypothetical protein